MMDRRHFLKSLTQMTAAGVLLAAPKIVPTVSASLVKGLPKEKGLVLKTADGERLVVNTNFGPGCKVLDVYKRGELIYAELYYSGTRFNVVSANGQQWADVPRNLIY